MFFKDSYLTFSIWQYDPLTCSDSYIDLVVTVIIYAVTNPICVKAGGDIKQNERNEKNSEKKKTDVSVIHFLLIDFWLKKTFVKNNKNA